jgi:hypothetical protein
LNFIKWSRVAAGIVQKLLDKVDLRLSDISRLGPRGKRECVYQFVPPDDERDLIFGQWLNRDELSVSVTNDINITAPVLDTISYEVVLTTHYLNTEVVSVTNNIDITTPVTDTKLQDIPQTLNELESPAVCNIVKARRMWLKGGWHPPDEDPRQ